MQASIIPIVQAHYLQLQVLRLLSSVMVLFTACYAPDTGRNSPVIGTLFAIAICIPLGAGHWLYDALRNNFDALRIDNDAVRKL